MKCSDKANGWPFDLTRVYSCQLPLTYFCMKCAVKWISLVLVLVGALNWGLVGFFDFNLVTKLLGAWPMAEKIVYDLVGVAALVYVIDMCFCGCAKDGEKEAGCCGGGACKSGKKM